VIQMGVHDPVKGKCATRRQYNAAGSQTIQPSMLLRGDVIPWRGRRLGVTWVGLQLCEIAPKVRVRAQELPDGPSQNLLFDADDHVPVEVPHVS
jgi:hypothetical protein